MVVTTASTWVAKVSISWKSWRKRFISRRESSIPIHVYHLKMRAKSNWGRVRQVIEQIEEARREGLEITANQYPYTAMQHPWRRLFPRWVQDAPVK